jgi:Holliday junction resolvase
MTPKNWRRTGNPAPEELGTNNEHGPLAQITTGTQAGGRASRQKGNRAERAIVRVLQEFGFAAERVPLSGAARGRFSGDVSVPLLGVDRRVEVKCRGNGFRELYRWLDGADFLIVKADRREPLVVVKLALAAEIAVIAERAKAKEFPLERESRRPRPVTRRM